MFQEAANKMINHFVENFKQSSLDYQYKTCQNHLKNKPGNSLTKFLISIYKNNKSNFINLFNKKTLDEQHLISINASKSRYSHLSSHLLNIYLNNKNKTIENFMLYSLEEQRNICQNAKNSHYSHLSKELVNHFNWQINTIKSFKKIKKLNDRRDFCLKHIKENGDKYYFIKQMIKAVNSDILRNSKLNPKVAHVNFSNLMSKFIRDPDFDKVDKDGLQPIWDSKEQENFFFSFANLKDASKVLKEVETEINSEKNETKNLRNSKFRS